MIENVKSTTIFITIGEMYVSHVSHNLFAEEINKLDIDKIYGRMNDQFIEKCYQFDNVQQAQEICRHLLKMGLKPVINKRSIVIRDEEFPVTEENKHDDLTRGIHYDTI
ncbi:hypothetical protein WHYPHY_6 [Bacillus phage WhyPhy]|uniref:Uncharacterized protein n=1 Tax=Bacillus phage WhyPhy TaxID=2801480 RepID=A0A7T8C4D9_9CAUD|nr:hypothetical protein KNV75_gp06 [Bacillus phage WhyPhy]QQO40339.1 hypothetical protein WHYPHY_6 [Bacillus phage WhyPhy]